MPRPKSRANALLPCRTTDAGVRAVTNIFTIDDAKSAMGIEQEETFRDADLLIAIPQAQALLERQANTHLSPVQVRSEYENPCNNELSCLAIPDIDTIIGEDASPIVVTDYPDEDGAGEVVTAANLTIDKSLRRTYITRSDGKYFAYGDDITTEITFYRGLNRESQMGNIAKSAMAMIMIEIFNINGVTAAVPPTLAATFIANPHFQNLIRLIRNNGKLTTQVY